MFEAYAFKWLETALDIGISEDKYWEMTIDEVMRAVESYKRRTQLEDKTKAAFDYIMADAIGRSVARIYSSSNKMPKIIELYPTLFDEEQYKAQEQANKDKQSALRFIQYAQAHNKKYKGGKQ